MEARWSRAAPTRKIIHHFIVLQPEGAQVLKAIDIRGNGTTDMVARKRERSKVRQISAHFRRYSPLKLASAHGEKLQIDKRRKSAGTLANDVIAIAEQVSKMRELAEAQRKFSFETVVHELNFRDVPRS